MSKNLKKFIFKTNNGDVLKIEKKTQEEAVERLGQLVTSIKDWPHVKVYKLKTK